MIDITPDEVKQRGWRKIGVLGFGDPSVMVYTQPMSRLNLAIELITPELQGPLNNAVVTLWEGRTNAEDTQAVREAVAYLRARQVDGIIPGCTELPLLLDAMPTRRISSIRLNSWPKRPYGMRWSEWPRPITSSSKPTDSSSGVKLWRIWMRSGRFTATPK